MMSIKVLCMAVLVLVAASSVGATDITYTKDTTVIKGCCKEYYQRWNFNFDNEWSSSTGLLGGIFKVVGGVLNLVFSILGLGSKPHSIDACFTPTRNDGEVINLLIKVLILNKPIYDKINPGLGALYLKVAIGNLIIGLSARAKAGYYYNGLKLKLLTGDESTWVAQLGLQNIGYEWNQHCNQFGGIEALISVKKAHYLYINELVQNLVIGKVRFVVSLLDNVLYTVHGLIGLVQNLLNSKLELVLNVLFTLTANLFVSIDINDAYDNIYDECYTYDQTYYETCYTV